MKTHLFGLSLLAFCGIAQAATCGGSAVLEAPLPGGPFTVVADSDPCTFYVSHGSPAGAVVTAFHRDGDHLTPLGSAVIGKNASGFALSQDGHLIVAANRTGAAFIDADRLKKNAADALLGMIEDGGTGAINAAITPDGKTAFLADEYSRGIAVVDVEKARTSGFGKDAVAIIPVPNNPVGLAISPDGATLFATVEIAGGPEAPRLCKAENGGSGMHPQGALIAIDVAKARSEPNKAVVASVHTGCSPVRVALSPDSHLAFVTARGSDALVVVDTAKLLAGNSDAMLGAIAVGTAPVGLAVAKDGKTIFVTNSNRFASNKLAEGSVSVISLPPPPGGKAVIGSYASGAFPRGLAITADGSTLLVANARSSSLTLIDLSTPPAQQ